MLILVLISSIAQAKSVKPIIFYNISDAHVIVPTEKNTWRLSKDGLQILEDTIEKVNRTNPEFIFLSGDVMEGKYYGMKNLEAAFTTLSKIKRPWFVVAGNHDGKYTHKENTVDEFTKQKFFEKFTGHGPTATQGYWKKEIPNTDLVLIGLNTSIESASAGKIDSEQLEWLKTTLAEIPAGKKAILTAHHPLVVFNPVIFDEDKKDLQIFVLQNYEEVQKAIEPFKPKILAVITGHTHTIEYQEKNGIHYIGTPSLNTWPNRYTRFEWNGETLKWEHIPISSQALIDEAWKHMTGETSAFKKIMKADDATLKSYILHSPYTGSFKVSN